MTVSIPVLSKKEVRTFSFESVVIVLSPVLHDENTNTYKNIKGKINFIVINFSI